MIKNQIFAGDNPNSWVYISSDEQIYDIIAYQDFATTKYSIKCRNGQAHVSVAILNFWWEIVDYVGKLD